MLCLFPGKWNSAITEIKKSHDKTKGRGEDLETRPDSNVA